VHVAVQQAAYENGNNPGHNGFDASDDQVVFGNFPKEDPHKLEIPNAMQAESPVVITMFELSTLAVRFPISTPMIVRMPSNAFIAKYRLAISLFSLTCSNKTRMGLIRFLNYFI
jgi:hypothetical protein